MKHLSYLTHQQQWDAIQCAAALVIPQPAGLNSIPEQEQFLEMHALAGTVALLDFSELPPWYGPMTLAAANCFKTASDAEYWLDGCVLLYRDGDRQTVARVEACRYFLRTYGFRELMAEIANRYPGK